MYHDTRIRIAACTSVVSVIIGHEFAQTSKLDMQQKVEEQLSNCPRSAVFIIHFKNPSQPLAYYAKPSFKCLTFKACQGEMAGSCALVFRYPKHLMPV